MVAVRQRLGFTAGAALENARNPQKTQFIDPVCFVNLIEIVPPSLAQINNGTAPTIIVFYCIPDFKRQAINAPKFSLVLIFVIAYFLEVIEPLIDDPFGILVVFVKQTESAGLLI